MDTLGFQVSVTFESDTFTGDIDQAEDVAPDTDSPGYDPEAPYGRTKSGRIRKRPIGRTSADTATRTPVRAEKLARQATAAVMQLNGFLIMGTLVSGMPRTSKKYSEHSDEFESQVYNALVLDTAMCEQILKAGVKSGKLMLMIAILGHIAVGVPDAVIEFRDRKNESESVL